MIVTVPLNERSYPIVIERGALRNAQTWESLPSEIAVLSNESVAPLYANNLSEMLRASGRRVVQMNQPDGEAHKSLSWMERAYDVLAEAGFSRRGAIVAVGGGVTGDWAGFVAATWMRGVQFVQVPTTLLAMVDSSVGGKTGVNHPSAKNLIGAFHQPSLVVADPEVLETLPSRELSAGLAEIIKYGVIEDAPFFGWLEAHLDDVLRLAPDALEHVIARSCEIKAQVVGEDERESDAKGRRAILNYGHTVGHAIEATTTYGRYLHGEAIAIGMTVAARLALELGVIAPDEGRDLFLRQTLLFQRAGLPTEPPADVSFEALWGAMQLDKKAREGRVNFVLPTRLGQIEAVEGVLEEQVRRALFATVLGAVAYSLRKIRYNRGGILLVTFP